MTKYILLFLLTCTYLFGAELTLEKSFQEAMIKADTVQKPVMFIISRHTCKYCIMLENETLSKPEVIEQLNKDFVVYIAYTDDDDGFPQQFWRPSTPTIWFLDDSGAAMSEPIMGAIDKTNLLQVLNTIKTRFDEQKNSQQYNYTKSKL